MSPGKCYGDECVSVTQFFINLVIKFVETRTFDVFAWFWQPWSSLWPEKESAVLQRGSSVCFHLHRVIDYNDFNIWMAVDTLLARNRDRRDDAYPLRLQVLEGIPAFWVAKEETFIPWLVGLGLLGLSACSVKQRVTLFTVFTSLNSVSVRCTHSTTLKTKNVHSFLQAKLPSGWTLKGVCEGSM